MPRLSEPVSAMTVEILIGDAAGLPAADHAAELLLGSGHSVLTLACTDAASAYAVLRTAMDYSYEHTLPVQLRLVCADETVYKAYRFQWNMWYAERKPTHEEKRSRMP